MTISAVLLDLDGTLVDTAPDMVAALNQVLIEEGQRRVPYAVARNEVSNGALGLLKLGFGAALNASNDDRLRGRFLQVYSENVSNKSRIFKGFSGFFDFISRKDIRWGVVTNKPEWLAQPLLRALGLAEITGCLVSGDSLPQRKPHPAPLHHAAKLMTVASQRCIYIGDAARDIQAGRAAGMFTVAASYGYIPHSEDPRNWGADFLIRHPGELVHTIPAAGELYAARA